MAFDLWLTFAASYLILTLIPGPSVLMVTGQALSHGRATGLRCVMGDVVGGVVLIALSLAGVGALLAASATLFLAVKWAGVAYLIYLGLAQIRAAQNVRNNGMARQVRRSSGFKIGFITGVLNPKAIMFYVAFLVQFADPAASFSVQFAVLVATSTVIVGGVLSGYVMLASQVRSALQSARAQRQVGYAGGGALIGGGLLVAATR